MPVSLPQDIRFAVRALARRPGFTLVALLTLGLGIGANTAVFSVVDGIVIEKLPYRDAHRLVTLGGTFISNAELLYLQERVTSFDGVAAYSPGWGMALTSGGEPVQLTAAKASENFLPMLGVPPVLGRNFTAEETTPGRDRVVILDHGLWRERFAGDSAIVGRSITLDGGPYTVIGVLPPRFRFATGSAANLLVPVTIDPGAWFHRGQNALAVMRLAASTTIEGATADLRSHLPRIRESLSYPADYGAGFALMPLQEFLVGSVRGMLLVLLGAVGLIVLIAAANVGNLLLVRATERRRELAVRLALGAGRWRVVRLLAAESLVLSSGGSLLGLLVATGGVGVLRGLLPADTPRLAEIGVDGRVLAVCMLVGLVTGLIGALPGLSATRTDPQSALGSGRSADATLHGGPRLRGILVATEIAMALVLVTGAGLMLRTLARLSRVDPGFRSEHVLSFHIQPTSGRLRSAAETRQYFAEVLDRVRAIPGVTNAGGIHHLPMSGYDWSAELDVEGRPRASGEPPARAGWRIIEGDYLGVMGIPLVAGRPFAAGDEAGSERVVLINQNLASLLFSGEDPVGRRIRAGNATRTEWARIVGVVGDVRHRSLDQPPRGELYLPLAQVSMAFLNVVARTSSDPLVVAAAASRAVREADPTVPISRMRALDDVVRGSTAGRRLVLQLLGAFAVLGLVLGAVGVYGVVSYGVTRRTREIGVRMALGAPRGEIVAVVVRHGLGYVVIGLAAGIVAALALTRAMRAVVYDVSTADPATYGTVAMVVLAVALVASWIPARRAARVDPVIAMRSDG